MSSNPIKVSIPKLERLFENSDNLEEEVKNYLNENLIKPTLKYFNELITKIFNCGILDDIINCIRQVTLYDYVECLDNRLLLQKAFDIKD